MTINAHDRIVDAVVALLAAAPALSDFIAEDDEGAIAEDACSAILVRFVESDPIVPSISGGPVDWNTRLGIECYARADASSSTGRASRRLHAAAFARLMADPTLGGAAMGMEPGQVMSEQDRRDSRLGCCIGQYLYLHRTQANTLEVA